MPARPQCSNCAYHAACARITRTYDGVLAEFRGDGILAYVVAHEDDAARTVRAGLDIADMSEFDWNPLWCSRRDGARCDRRKLRARCGQRQGTSGTVLVGATDAVAVSTNCFCHTTYATAILKPIVEV